MQHWARSWAFSLLFIYYCVLVTFAKSPQTFCVWDTSYVTWTFSFCLKLLSLTWHVEKNTEHIPPCPSWLIRESFGLFPLQNILWACNLKIVTTILDEYLKENCASMFNKYYFILPSGFLSLSPSLSLYPTTACLDNLAKLKYKKITLTTILQ